MMVPKLTDRCLTQAVLAEHAAATEEHGMAVPSASRDLALDLLLLQVSHVPFLHGSFHIRLALCLLACLGTSVR